MNFSRFRNGVKVFLGLPIPSFENHFSFAQAERALCSLAPAGYDLPTKDMLSFRKCGRRCLSFGQARGLPLHLSVRMITEHYARADERTHRLVMVSITPSRPGPGITLNTRIFCPSAKSGGGRAFWDVKTSVQPIPCFGG